MSKITLNWEADGFIDGFNIYRSTNPMDTSNLPTPIATNISEKNYIDSNLAYGTTYYYRIGSIKGSAHKISDEVLIFAGNDQYFNFVDLLIFADQMPIVDMSTQNRVITNSNVVLVDESVITPKFDNKSMYFNNPSYVRASLNTLGLNDFTAEFYLNYSSLPSGYTFCRLFSLGSTFAGLGNILISSEVKTGTKPSIQLNVYDGGWAEVKKVDAFNFNTWTHICLMRKDGIFYMFVDGILVLSISNRTFVPIQNTAYLGADATNTGGLKGYINSFRFTNGVARYSTSGFTPPISKFTNL